MSKLIFFLLISTVYGISIFAQDKDKFEEKQDANYEEVKKEFSNLKVTKTDNFYINFNSPSVENYPKTLEGLVTLFKGVMSIKGNEKVFRGGRLEIYLWEKRSEFVRFAAKFEGFDANFAGGYSTTLPDEKGGYQRLNLPLETGAQGKDANQARNLIVLFHEGTHAMFAQYKTDTPLPTWINEGLADYFAFGILHDFYPKLEVNDKSKTNHIQFLKRQIKADKLRPFRQFFHQQGTSGGADYEAYALGWCIASLLLNKSSPFRVQTVNFINKVKNSTELGSDIKVTGTTQAEVQKNFMEAKKNQEKILESYFLECFKMDIDKFGELIYGQLKKNPDMLNNM